MLIPIREQLGYTGRIIPVPAGVAPSGQSADRQVFHDRLWSGRPTFGKRYVSAQISGRRTLRSLAFVQCIFLDFDRINVLTNRMSLCIEKQMINRINPMIIGSIPPNEYIIPSTKPNNNSGK